jgi:hypothetical protein
MPSQLALYRDAVVDVDNAMHLVLTKTEAAQRNRLVLTSTDERSASARQPPVCEPPSAPRIAGDVNVLDYGAYQRQFALI